ncbi:RDD family protein [Hymenobacter ruricola]|uniref:RDD family protein n=1 Tax=Hymenobacter ruricola TaxID=2791023 RepID=A0ABS0I0J8_9BACT|nr:RDD family protein [Hymenobacter ruricola]MBF9220079.1 RDD family protein [Hymenobacter ruricola]
MQQDYSFSEFATQPVELPYATTGQRLGNYLIDVASYYFFFIVLCLVLGVVIGLTGHTELQRYAEGPASTLAVFALMFLYFFVLEVSTGRTIGKLITRTRVVMQDGSELTTKAILLRTLCRLIPFDAFSFLGGDSGWHDTLSKTRVVQIPR